VWRKANEVGVSFVAEPMKTAPRRSQVVSSSDRAGAQVSLRRPSAATLAARVIPRVNDLPPPAAPETLVIAADDITTETTVPAAAAATAEAPREAVVPAAKSDAAPAQAPAKTTPQRPAIPIVIADDDPDDRLLIGDVFRESAFSHPISFVENGEELLQYLRGQGVHAGRAMPGLILLDLNMPKMDGRTALMHLKADTALRRIPVIVLTTSNAEDDIQRTYDLGVSAYVPKPNSFDGLLDLVQSLNNYWMRFVASPVSQTAL
jgi:CheY-like chemotaxis protein